MRPWQTLWVQCWLALAVVVGGAVPRCAMAQIPTHPSAPQQRMELPINVLDSTSGHLTIRKILMGSGKEAFAISFLDSTDAPVGGAVVDTTPLRVLFIGNSLTFFNAMPRIFSALAAQGLHRRVVVGLVSIPGGPPDVLWKGTDVRTVIQRLPWDDVVLQIRPYRLRDPMVEEYAQLFGLEASARHARTWLWVQPRSPDETQAQAKVLDSVFDAAATATGATLAPIPAAWDAVFHADTTLWHSLFWDLAKGNDHPSPLGSYLDALVFYHAITGRSPIGLPHTAGSVSIPDRTAMILQKTAGDLLRGGDVPVDAARGGGH